MPRSRSTVARPAALVDLALDGAPEQVEHLGHDDHRGDPVLAQRVEDDPRVPAPDVEDVGADIERVVQPDRLLEQVRQRQQRHEPVLHRRDDPVERLDRCDDVVVGQHHALRRAGRAAREDELEELVRRRAASRRPGAPPSRPGRAGSSVGRLGRQCVDRRRREVGQAGLRGIGRVAARAEDRGGGRPTRGRSPSIASARHPQVERHEDEPGVHRAEVGGRQLGRRRAPGQDPVARLQVERAQPPGGDPRPPIELAVGPVRRSMPSSWRRPSAGRSPKRVTARLEQVDQGRATASSGVTGRRIATTRESMHRCRSRHALDVAATRHRADVALAEDRLAMHPVLVAARPCHDPDPRRLHRPRARRRAGALLPRAASPRLARPHGSSGSRSRPSSAGAIGARADHGLGASRVLRGPRWRAADASPSSTAARASSARSPAAISAIALAKRAFGYTRSTGDCYVLAIPVATAIGRVGCFLSELPLGTPTTLPWGMSRVGRGGRGLRPLSRLRPADAPIDALRDRLQPRRGVASSSASAIASRSPGDAPEAVPAGRRGLPLPRRVRPRERAAGAGLTGPQWVLIPLIGLLVVHFARQWRRGAYARPAGARPGFRSEATLMTDRPSQNRGPSQSRPSRRTAIGVLAAYVQDEPRSIHRRGPARGGADAPATPTPRSRPRGPRLPTRASPSRPSVERMSARSSRSLSALRSPLYGAAASPRGSLGVRRHRRDRRDRAPAGGDRVGWVARCATRRPSLAAGLGWGVLIAVGLPIVVVLGILGICLVGASIPIAPQ